MTAPGGELEYTVINTGDVPIMLGAAYALDRHADGGWQPVEVGVGFHAWGRRLSPGDRYQGAAALREDLAAGRYRLRKHLRADADPHPGYEWVAQAGIAPVEPTAEFVVQQTSND